MRPWFRALPLVLTLGPLAPAQAAPVLPARVEERQLVWPAAGPYRLRLENVRGRVAVTRWPKTAAFLAATLRAARPLEPAEQALLAEARVEIEAPRSGDARARVVFPSLAGRHPAVIATAAAGLRVDWRLVLPPETALEVRQEAGSIVARGHDGRLDLFTRDGDVDVTDASGWVEAGNERGAITLRRLAGDALLRTHRGVLTLREIEGDVRAISGSGPVRLVVTPRWVGEVAYHTVSGVIRSDLATRLTDLQPGDTGYVGVLLGPLAHPGAGAPWRVRVDTTAGDLTVASERASAGI
ncbi:MAG: hypothetical protein VKQ33_07780 [Candidatus Sericytochromatia bacterium]|nr:hypothetical protein [Candidatus Sericytochromatia bacterium]